MKKQTYIAMIRDNAGQAITFERFTCKRAATVKQNMQQLFKSDLYRACTKGAATVDVYATPGGYHREPAPVLTFEV